MNKRIIIKAFVAISIVLLGAGFVYIGTIIKKNNIIDNGTLNMIPGFLLAFIVVTFIVNFVITIKMNKRKKIDADLLEAKIVNKMNLAKSNYKKYYRIIKMHLFYSDLYYGFILITLSTLFITLSMLGNPSTGYIVFIIGVALYSIISYIIGVSNDENNKQDELTESEYPELWSLLRKMSSMFKIKKEIKCYIDYDCNARAFEDDKNCIITIGCQFLQIANYEELESILMHEFAHIYKKHTLRLFKTFKRIEKWYIAMDKVNGPAYYAHIMLYPISIILSNDYQVFNLVTSKTLEIEADKVVKEKGDAQTFVNALAKMSIFEIFSNNDNYNINEVYYSDLVPDNYYNIIYNKFIEYYKTYHQFWKEMIVKRIPARIESHMTFKERMDLMNINDFEISFNEQISELDKMLKKANQRIKDFVKLSYQDLRLKNYLKPLDLIEEYEQNKDYDQVKLYDVAAAYQLFSKLEQANQIYDSILFKNSNNPKALFAKGTLLLSMYNNEGIEIIYKAMSLNDNYMQGGITLLGEYFLKMGLEEQVNNLREYIRKKRNYIINIKAQEQPQYSDKLIKTTISDDIVNEVINEITKENHIVKIYFADKVIDEKHQITVIGILIKNDAVNKANDIMNHIHDYLENQRSEKYTFVYLNNAPVYQKKFEMIEDSLKYSKDHVYNK